MIDLLLVSFATLTGDTRVGVRNGEGAHKYVWHNAVQRMVGKQRAAKTQTQINVQAMQRLNHAVSSHRPRTSCHLRMTELMLNATSFGCAVDGNHGQEHRLNVQGKVGMLHVFSCVTNRNMSFG
jgi:hypothetical protein